MYTVKIQDNFEISLRESSLVDILYKDSTKAQEVFTHLDIPSDLVAVIVVDDCNIPVYHGQSAYIVNHNGKTVATV